MTTTDKQNSTFRRLLVLAIAAGIAGLIWGGQAGLDWYEQSRTERLLQECRRQDELENWDGLLAAADAWIRQRPQDAEPLLFAAKALLKSGEIRQAVDRLKLVPDTDPKAILSLTEAMSLLFEELNEPFEAVEVCERILRIDPKVMLAHQRLIFFYGMTLQHPKLYQQIRDAINAGAEPVEAYTYLMMMDHFYLANGHEWNDRWLQTHPDTEIFVAARAIHFVETADNRQLQEQTSATELEKEDRERYLQDYLDRYPNNTALLAVFLNRYTSESRLDEVETLLSRVPSDAGDNSLFWRYRGWYQAATGDLEGARQSYEKSIELFPFDWSTWNGLAGVARQQGRLDEAEGFQALSHEGNELRRFVIRLDDARTVTDEQLRYIALYARHCGAGFVADRLKQRLIARRGAAFAAETNQGSRDGGNRRAD